MWLPFSYFIFDQLHAVAVHYCVSEWYETLIDIVVARTFESSQCQRRIWGGPQAHCISQCTPDTALAPPRHKVASQDERLHHVFIHVSLFLPSFSLAWLSSAWLWQLSPIGLDIRLLASTPWKSWDLLYLASVPWHWFARLPSLSWEIDIKLRSGRERWLMYRGAGPS